MHTRSYHTFQPLNSKRANQSAWMHSLTCTVVLRIHKNAHYSACSSFATFSLTATCTWMDQFIKVSMGAKIRNRYNQVPHLTNDTNGKVTNSQLNTTDESQEVSSFPAVDKCRAPFAKKAGKWTAFCLSFVDQSNYIQYWLRTMLNRTPVSVKVVPDSPAYVQKCFIF